MSIVLKSGSLKIVEPSGPVQRCYGIALLLPSKVLRFEGGGSPRVIRAFDFVIKHFIWHTDCVIWTGV